nr:hypothetical protein L203_00845 [Cryptococcus depauperatus CBS 7841]
MSNRDDSRMSRSSKRSDPFYLSGHNRGLLMDPSLIDPSLIDPRSPASGTYNLGGSTFENAYVPDEIAHTRLHAASQKMTNQYPQSQGDYVYANTPSRALTDEEKSAIMKRLNRMNKELDKLDSSVQELGDDLQNIQSRKSLNNPSAAPSKGLEQSTHNTTHQE